MSNAFRERRKAQGFCITGGCESPPMEGRSQCIGCSKALTKRTSEYRKASTGKAPADLERQRRAAHRQKPGNGPVFVGGKSASARARGKAPIAPTQMERSKVEEYLAQGAQLHDLRATPPAEIPAQHGSVDWKPPTGVRAPKRIPPGPRDGAHGGEVARPKSAAAEFAVRGESNSVLW